VASGGFALYTANFGSYNKAWGTLAAVVITLVWLWLTSAALLLALRSTPKRSDSPPNGATVTLTRGAAANDDSASVGVEPGRARVAG
jgi:hypothetical protein